MNEEAHPLVVTIRGFVRVQPLTFVRIDRDGARNGLVKATVERAEVLRANRRVRLERQLGNGLTDVAIIVNHLRDGESFAQQVVAVEAGAPVDFDGPPA